MAGYQVTIHVPEGDLLWPVSMLGVTTAGYAVLRVCEALDIDPEAQRWFLYDPVIKTEIPDGETMLAYDQRVICLRWEGQEL